ncbi:MAG TPA: hypothetical protein VGU43_01955 [Thermoplasmata archaeon]|nr:hypothetical protein [Thermoplasmata archaeon]
MPERAHAPSGEAPEPEAVRHAEEALRRMGYDRVRDPVTRGGGAAFWVRASQASGPPIRVLLDTPEFRPSIVEAGDASILVVPTAAEAEAAWAQMRSRKAGLPSSDLRILVVPAEGVEREPHWHDATLTRLEVLWLATGVLVGLLREAAAGGDVGSVDFEELLQILKRRFHVDVLGTLGVSSDEEALWMLYQIAHRFTYAPGDPGPNVHMLVLKPVGPAARLPWFAG